VTNKNPGQYFPTTVQKSYFMLADCERQILNRALEQYLPSKSVSFTKDIEELTSKSSVLSFSLGVSIV
jgi:hypothetical protein